MQTSPCWLTAIIHVVSRSPHLGVAGESQCQQTGGSTWQASLPPLTYESRLCRITPAWRPSKIARQYVGRHVTTTSERIEEI